MDELAAAAAVAAMDIDDNPGEHGQLGSTCTTEGAGESIQADAGSVDVDKENDKGAPSNGRVEATNPKVMNAKMNQPIPRRTPPLT